MEPRLLAVLAVALLAYAAVSRRAERSPITAPIVFLGIGLVCGAGGLGWMELEFDHHAVHPLAELTLVLVLFIDASRIDLACLRRERGLPMRLLGIGMPLTIGFGAAVAMGVFPGLSWSEAFLLAAILAPTDAALGQAVVSSELVPVRIRQSLNVESGLNDGIALPLVLVFASLAGAELEGSAGDVAGWLQFALLQVTLGPLAGGAVGYFGGKLIGVATERGWVNDSFEELAGLGLALLAFGAAELVGGNGFISAFVAGLVVGNTARGICNSLYEFGEAEGQLLALLVFLAFGAVIVPAYWGQVDGATVLYAVLSLTVVRMLPVALALLGTGLRPASWLFLGWFGPRGLASILFALLVAAGAAEGDTHFMPTVMLTVLLSTLLHGVTAYPFAKRYSRYVLRQPERCEQEHRDVSEHPVRHRHTA